jgi:hypothetical protein
MGDAAEPLWPNAHGAAADVRDRERASAVLTAVYQYRGWTPLQRQYLWAYVRSGIAFTSDGTYDVLQLVDQRGRRPALDEEVLPMTLGAADPVFVLTEAARHAGVRQLAWRTDRYPHATLHRWLRRAIYNDQRLVDLAMPTLWGAVAVWLGMLVGATAQRVVIARALRVWSSPVHTMWDLAPVVTVPVRQPAIGAPLTRPDPVPPPGLPAPAAVPHPALAPSTTPSSAAVRAEVWPPHFFV